LRQRVKHGDQGKKGNYEKGKFSEEGGYLAPLVELGPVKKGKKIMKGRQACELKELLKKPGTFDRTKWGKSKE